jgi:hypothetical protein
MRAAPHTMRHLRKRTSRTAVLALTVAGALATSAQAADLPTTATATDAAAQLSQTAATTPAPATETTAAAQTTRQTAATAVSPAQPAVEQVAKTAGAAAGPARPAVEATVRSVGGAAGPASRTGTEGQATPAKIAAHSERDGDRANRNGRSEPVSPKTTGTHRKAPPAAHALKSEPNAAAGRSGPIAATPSRSAGHRAGAPTEEDPTSPIDGSAAYAGSTASASSSSFSLGGLALLAAVFILAAPAIKRRLRVDGAFLRPTLFVAVLERPG